MKKIITQGKYLLVGVALALSNNSCTNLDEKLYDQIETKNFLKTDEEFIAALGGAYTSLYPFMNHNTMFSLNEVSTDEMIIPVRGGDWGDGGQWVRVHRHEYTPAEESVNNAWQFCFKGVATCNRLLEQLAAADAAKAAPFLAELKVLRALYYYWLLDMYGNVPIVTNFKEAPATPATETRAKVYTFIEAELVANVPLLTKTVDVTTYGRMTYYGGKALQAKLYMNAAVYTGTPQWKKASDAIDEITDATTKFKLEQNFFDCFKTKNEDSKETVFPIVYDKVNAQGFNLPQMTLHYSSQATFNMTDQPWNGYCSLADFYNTFDAADGRKASFLAGPQFAADGITRILDDKADPTDPDGKPLTYTPELNEHEPNCFRQAGVRVGKYQFENGATPNLSNDFPLFRVGDMMLLKAECILRDPSTKRASDPTADQIVATIRARSAKGALPYPTAITLDELLKERGREGFAEAWRRQDLIRFGKYNAATRYHPADPAAKAACLGVFPIPKNQISANPKLVQNECYR